MFERYSDRARQLIFIALWSARKRGGSYIEPEDLLHALIREDRGEFAALSAEVFPGALGPIESAASGHRPFFAQDVARNLLCELHEDPDSPNPEKQNDKREPVPRADMPMSSSLKHVLALAAKVHQNDTKSIEPLHLLAAILAGGDSRAAQLLRDHHITSRKLAMALDSGPTLEA
jgi:ATP-dependent Clp protease ATP-binding subunit ClpA